MRLEFNVHNITNRRFVYNFGNPFSGVDSTCRKSVRFLPGTSLNDQATPAAFHPGELKHGGREAV
jgi:hypothetical protein